MKPAIIPTPNNAMLVTIYRKQVYGRTLFYPINETAKLFAQIAGTETLQRETRRLITELGYEVREELNPEATDEI